MFATGDLASQPNDNAAVNALRLVVHDALISMGYTVVKTLTSNVANNQYADVFQSPTNVVGKTWYLYLGCSFTNLYLFAMEGYDPATGTVTRPAGVSSTVGSAFDNTTSVAYSNPISSGSQTGIMIALFSSLGVTTTYVLSVTHERVVLATRASGSQTGWYVGLYEDVLPAAVSPFPLVTVKTGGVSSGTGWGATSREPNQAAGANPTNGFSVFMWNSGTNHFGPASASPNFYSGVYQAARAGLTSSRSTQQGLRGAMFGLYYAPLLNPVLGDRLVAGSTALVCVSDATGGPGFWVDSGV